MVFLRDVSELFTGVFTNQFRSRLAICDGVAWSHRLKWRLRPVGKKLARRVPCAAKIKQTARRGIGKN